MIEAKVVGDSKNEFGNRITTMVVTFPRIILAEFNTHRMFSRNSASSRAIPFEKMVKSVQDNPFAPIAWQKDHKGMQGVEYITDLVDIDLNKNAWINARDNAIASARYLNHGVQEGRDNAVTKQLCNRLLEPFMWHTVIITATEWENFFALRCSQYEDIAAIKFRSRKDFLKKHPGVDDIATELDWLKCNKGQAEIHMMALAEAMWDAYNESTPKLLEANEWHIPFLDKIDSMLLHDATVTQETREQIMESPETLVQIATVMAARTSYTVVGDDLKPLTYKRMIEIHDQMLTANPKHMSPFEHCARAMSTKEQEEYGVLKPVKFTEWQKNSLPEDIKEATVEEGWCGNFRGFIQYRKMILNENIT